MEKITVTQTEVLIEQLKRYVAEVFTPEISRSVHFDVRELVGRMATELCSTVDLPLEPLETFTELAIFKTPKTWFDHFRLTYFPKFLSKKFPIKWKTERQSIQVKCGAVYPKLPVAFPNYGGVIRYNYMSRSPMSSYPIMKDGEYD